MWIIATLITIGLLVLVIALGLAFVCGYSLGIKDWTKAIHKELAEAKKAIRKINNDKLKGE